MASDHRQSSHPPKAHLEFYSAYQPRFSVTQESDRQIQISVIRLQCRGSVRAVVNGSYALEYMFDREPTPREKPQVPRHRRDTHSSWSSQPEGLSRESQTRRDVQSIRPGRTRTHQPEDPAGVVTAPCVTRGVPGSPHRRRNLERSR